MSESIESREATHGSKMIEVKVRFWTNDLADGKKRIRRKHAWGSGVVRIERNASHTAPTGQTSSNGSVRDGTAAHEDWTGRTRHE